MVHKSFFVNLILFLLISLSGCIKSADKKAEVETYKAIKPAYVVYVASDPKLSKLEKRVRLRTVYTWAKRLGYTDEDLTTLRGLIKENE